MTVRPNRGGVGEELRDHEGRIRRLEATPDTSSPGGGGIQFETYPQAGDWLYVETTGPVTGAPSGFYDMELVGDAIHIQGWSYLEMQTDGDGFLQADNELRLASGSTMTLDTAGLLDLEGDSVYIHIEDQTTGVFDVDAKYISLTATELLSAASNQPMRLFGGLSGSDYGGEIIIGFSDSQLHLTAASQVRIDSTGVSTGVQIIAKLGSGDTFEILDSSDAPILRVDEAGGYHILTGAAWVSDL